MCVKETREVKIEAKEIKVDVFLHLFAMFFKERNLKKSSLIIWKNKHNFSIIWSKKTSATSIICHFY